MKGDMKGDMKVVLKLWKKLTKMDASKVHAALAPIKLRAILLPRLEPPLSTLKNEKLSACGYGKNGGERGESSVSWRGGGATL